MMKHTAMLIAALILRKHIQPACIHLGSLILLGMLPCLVKAQLTGTKNIPGDYASLATAITDLNSQGVGAGGVTLNLLAGNAQTAPSGGYVIGGVGSQLLTTTSMANQVILQGNGNTITASSSHTSGSFTDGIFKLIGADWINIVNFNLQENNTNNNDNEITEWGIALLYVSTTDGAQNNKIQGNTINLDRTFANTFGIYSNSMHSATDVMTTASATTGNNNGLKIYSNIITDVNWGIVVVGPQAAADQNDGLEIGTSSPNANSITNYGTTGVISAFAGITSGAVNGISVRNTKNFNISYNTIESSNGGTISGTLRGIYIQSFTNTPTGTFTNNISNNSISVRSGVAAGLMNGIFVEATTASTTSTLNINNNDFLSITHTVTPASGTITLLSTLSPAKIVTINNNTFTNLNVNTSGFFTFINHNYLMPAGGSQTIDNNSIVTAFSKTANGGSVTCINGAGSTIVSDGLITHTNNNFSNITVIGSTAVSGINNNDGGATSQTPKIVTGNTFTNWTGGSTPIAVITYNQFGGTTSTVSSNTIGNITGTSFVTGISIGSNGNNGNPLVISSNTINNLAGGGTVTGIGTANSSPQISITNNSIHTLSTTGSSSTAVGIANTGNSASITIAENTIHTIFGSGSTNPVVNGISSSTGSGVNIRKNKIFGLSQSSAIASATIPGVNGILISGGTNANVTNNLIGNLTSPAANQADAIRGISVTASTANATYNVNYNTILINASSTGANFGTTGIFHNGSATATTGVLQLRNNLIVNLSTPSGTGNTVAHRRSNTNLANYGNASNHNLFYAGTPGASNLIFFDGINSDQLLSDYKARVEPRDALAVTEAISGAPGEFFQSLTGADAGYLHIVNGESTLVESGASNISGITDDYDGQPRQGNGGYSGTGVAPDIGADEFEGVGLAVMTYVSSTTTQSNTSGIPSNAIHQEVIGIQIVTTGAVSPISATAFTINTAGTTNTGDITNAKIFYTGSSADFSPTNQFGSTVAMPNGSFEISGTQQLVTGTNYFWLTVDVLCDVTLGNLVDAQCTSLTVGIPRTPTVQNPAGHRVIVLGPLSGNYTVGGGGTYETLSAAIDDLTSKGMGGHTTFTIQGSTSEPGPMIINPWTECNGNNFKLTIKPAAGVAVTVTGHSGTSPNALVKLNGVDSVLIDGINSGGASLTFENTATAAGSAVLWLASAGPGMGASGNTIRNCTFMAGVQQNLSITTTYGLVIGGASLGTSVVTIAPGNDNDHNTITGNTFLRARYAVVLFGGSITNPNLGNVFTQNIVGPPSFGQDQVGKCGLLLREEEGTIIRGNTFRCIGGGLADTPASADRVGIAISSEADWPATTVYAKHIIIDRNIIHDVVDERTFSAVGIAVSASGGGLTDILVSNNMVSNIRTNGTTSDRAIGIGAAEGINDRYLFNSISMAGDTDPDEGANSPNQSNYGLDIFSANVVNPVLRNNLIVMDLFSSSNPAVENACVHIPAAYSWGSGSSDYNDLYADPSNVQGNAGAIGNSIYTTLAGWQTASGQDAHSVEIAPVFVGPTDLHIMPDVLLDNAGLVIGDLLTDIDEAPRNFITPDIGADEFSLGCDPLVTNTNDAGASSLRAAIDCISDGDYVVFDAVLNDQTIALTSGEIAIDKNVGLWGLGKEQLTISGSNLSRIFHVEPGQTLRVQHLALEDGNDLMNGGAVWVQGLLLLDTVRLSGNQENGVPKAVTLQGPGGLEVRGSVDMFD